MCQYYPESVFAVSVSLFCYQHFVCTDPNWDSKRGTKLFGLMSTRIWSSHTATKNMSGVRVPVLVRISARRELRIFSMLWVVVTGIVLFALR